MERKRDQLGRYADEFSEEKVLDVFLNREDQAKPLTAGDITKELGWSRRTVHTKLNELSDEDGPLKSREVGARAKVWWTPLNHVPLTQLGVSRTEFPSTVDEILEIVNMREGLDEEVERQRAEAILTAYEYLQREKRATSSEIREYTHKRHDFDDATEKQTSEQRQWILYLRDGLKELPGVEPPGTSRGRLWNFIDPNSDRAQALDIEIDDWINNLETEIVGNDTSIKRQKALIQHAYDYLKQKGEAQKGDFEDHLLKKTGYTAHYTEFSGFWSYTLRDALAENRNVSPPAQGSSTFSYAEN